MPFSFYSSREFFQCLFTITFFQQIYGHGRMEEPPARNVAWRFGFQVPVNYEDVGLNCGGLSIQRVNKGKCGVCGDSYSGPRFHEAGGKYATNTIVRYYQMESWIDVKILITANHAGYMEFRLCPALDPDVEVTQECLDQNQLDIEGHGKRFLVEEDMSSLSLRLRLPDGLTCARCVLQWRYHAGNSWGTDFRSGESCLGCGLQEEFYNCADISISPSGQDDLGTLIVENNENQYDYDDLSALTKPPMLLATRPSTEAPTTTTTTPLTHVIFGNDAIEIYQPRKKVLHCFTTNEVLKPIVGIEKWCQQICSTECPPTLCVCVEI